MKHETYKGRNCVEVLATEPDMDAVTEALNSPVVMDALHAESIDMDQNETLKARILELADKLGTEPTDGSDLIGKTFRPTPENAHRRASDVITPVRTWVSSVDGQPSVSYAIESDNWKGDRVVSHSALSVELFRTLYRQI